MTNPAQHAISDRTGPVVLGLAGGISSGKSTVARAFARLGWVVIDSDAEAKAALRLPDIKDALRRWWGDGVILPDGEVDRSAVAAIVFADAAQRKRLESLIHPLIARSRREAIAAATARTGRVPPGVIYDAPLLFEAGLDAECDAVVFVDAPEPLRMARARAVRGWSDADYSVRQAAQWPLDRKRARCRFVITNDRDGVDPDRQCADIAAILSGGQG